ncbi:uncharacterized protein LOC117640561 [Thrips palmi]|uniref:Uncharacterized protein LOC117640561 n=1 Tax=Thrips palmi TaxID=161013 RepID=A0A6P8Y0K1_THRPL|nr:uncharacterized protein LOC117640561 [Thrips palmi]
MECPVCLEDYDAAKRRPKSLPCGHTFCSHCLGGLQPLSCPHCRRDFSEPAESLPDNFAVLGIVDQQRPLSSASGGSQVLARKLWCVDCDKATADADACLDRGHTLCSPRKVLSERAAPRMQMLGNADTESSKVVGSLEDAKSTVEGLLQEWRTKAQLVKEAKEKLQAAVDEGIDLDTAQPENLEQLLDAASLMDSMDCKLKRKGGADWVGDLGGGESLIHALVLHLHRHGRIAKEPTQPQPAATATPEQAVKATQLQAQVAAARAKAIAAIRAEAGPIPALNLNNLSETSITSSMREKESLLASVRQSGVRKLTYVYCHRDPAWVLDVLRSAAPTLEELDVREARREHLLAAHAMPRLRRMALVYDSGQDTQPPVLPALQRATLKWLRVWTLPRPTLTSLLRAHSASLEVLWLRVGTSEGGDWPHRGKDLDALLCGLRVSRVVLWRYGMSHLSAPCQRQLAAVRRLLPAASVRCMDCDNVLWEAF